MRKWAGKEEARFLDESIPAHARFDQQNDDDGNEVVGRQGEIYVRRKEQLHS